jgi:hypothetical protein
LHNCYVFFVAYRKRRISWRAIKRCKGLAKRSLIVWLIATIGRSHFVHVCVGSSDVVLDQMIDGPRFYATALFCMKYPRLAWCYEIKCPRKPDIGLAENCGPVKITRTLARRATRGLISSNDCVSTTSDILRDAGINIPKSVVTPDQLWDHLRSQGHELIEMDLAHECAN